MASMDCFFYFQSIGGIFYEKKTASGRICSCFY
nr:MAG TPA: Tubulin alpha-1B chain, Tubulin beta-2B, OXYGEN TRANSPORT [Caudoviricetes sp.]